MVSEQLIWLIRKGDLLLTSEEREIEKELVGDFREAGSRCFNLPIYEYLDEDVPVRYKIAHEVIRCNNFLHLWDKQTDFWIMQK